RRSERCARRQRAPPRRRPRRRGFLMSLPAKLRIGVRSGRLAAALAHEVQHALEQAHPNLEVEIVRIAGSGAHVHDAPPRAAGFTAELDRALAAGKIDAAL